MFNVSIFIFGLCMLLFESEVSFDWMVSWPGLNCHSISLLPLCLCIIYKILPSLFTLIHYIYIFTCTILTNAKMFLYFSVNSTHIIPNTICKYLLILCLVFSLFLLRRFDMTIFFFVIVVATPLPCLPRRHLSHTLLI